MTDRQQPEAIEGDKPVGEVVGDLTSEVATLLHKEVELAMIELKGEMRQAAKAGGMLSGAALTGYLTLLFASFALAWLLDSKMPRFLAFGLVAMVHGVTAATLLSRGHQEVKKVDPVPTETVETLKENVEWAKAQRG
jgi:hypothetical protein